MRARSPDSDINVPLLRQRWHSVSFVHWRGDPELVAAHLPEGLTVDTYDGTAWLGIVPLEMVDVRPAGLPALPGVSRFPETNLRTYVRGPEGKQGLWFFSLDADSRWITVITPLLLGVPYVHARLSIERTDVVRYRGHRRDGVADYDIVVRPGDPVTPTERDVWLTDRWRAYSHHGGRLLEVPVRHSPWPLRTATCERLDETLAKAAGLPAVDGDPVVHFSDGVDDVVFGSVHLPN